MAHPIYRHFAYMEVNKKIDTLVADLESTKRTWEAQIIVDKLREAAVERKKLEEIYGIEVLPYEY